MRRTVQERAQDHAPFPSFIAGVNSGWQFIAEGVLMPVLEHPSNTRLHAVLQFDGCSAK